MLTARIAGCVFSVSVSWSSGPSKHDAAERLAERGVGLVEGLAADREGLGERLAHADLLRTLAGKQEGDHGCGTTAAAAMSRSTRSMKRPAAKR